MTEEDVALFRQAEQHAKSGRQLEAYNLFRILRERNPDRIEILFWIVETTPHAGESEQALVTIKRLAPNHPHIPRTEAVHHRRFQAAIIYAPPPPVLRCPYCGFYGPALTRSKVSTAGWVILVVLLIFTIVLFWVGLLFLEQYYICSRCGSRIAMIN